MLFADLSSLCQLSLLPDLFLKSSNPVLWIAIRTASSVEIPALDRSS